MDAIEEMITNPTVTMGLGDSGVHVGQIMDVRTRLGCSSTGSRPAAKSSWMRPSVAGPATPAIFGIEGRGALHEGTYADLNVIDLSRSES